MADDDERDAEPAPDHWYGPWCADYGVRRRDTVRPAYLVTLAQLGMRIDENGRYWASRPPACWHGTNERNTGRDQLTCDGCSKEQPQEPSKET